MNILKSHCPPSDCILKTIILEEGPVHTLTVSANGDRLCTGFSDKIILWDLNNGSRLVLFETCGDCAVLSSDGKTIVSSDGKKIKICDSERQVLAYEILDNAEYPHITTLAVSQDARIAITGFSETNVNAWNLPGDEVIGTIYNVPGGFTNNEAISISADGKIAVICDSHGLLIWEIEDHFTSEIDDIFGNGYHIKLTPSGTFKGPSFDESYYDFYVHRVQITSSCKKAITLSHKELISVWNLENPALEMTVNFACELDAFSISGDGKTVALALESNTSSESKGSDIILLDMENLQILCRYLAHKSTIWGLSMTPDGKKLVSSSWDPDKQSGNDNKKIEKSIKVWDIGKCIKFCQHTQAGQ